MNVYRDRCNFTALFSSEIPDNTVLTAYSQIKYSNGTSQTISKDLNPEGGNNRLKFSSLVEYPSEKWITEGSFGITFKNYLSYSIFRILADLTLNRTSLSGTEEYYVVKNSQFENGAYISFY